MNNLHLICFFQPHLGQALFWNNFHVVLDNHFFLRNVQLQKKPGERQRTLERFFCSVQLNRNHGFIKRFPGSCFTRPLISSIDREAITFEGPKPLPSINSSTCRASPSISDKSFSSSGLSGIFSPGLPVLLIGEETRGILSSSKISPAVVTSFAPCFKSELVPSERAESAFPGTANTSRPSSSARFAVMSAPLFSLASTTRTPRDRPLMIRFLTGKCCLSGSICIGYSEITAPFSMIS